MKRLFKNQNQTKDLNAKITQNFYWSSREKINWHNAGAINYLFVEIKLHGHDCLVVLIYNPPRVDGLLIFAPILEEFYPKYKHGLL
jgi:hypothetical protein